MFGNLKKKLAALAEKITQKAEEAPQDQRAQEIEAIKQAVQAKPEEKPAEAAKEEAKQAEPEAEKQIEAKEPTEAKEPEAVKEAEQKPAEPEEKKAEEISKIIEAPIGEMAKKGLSLKERLAALKKKAKGETEEAKPGIKEKPAEQKEEIKAQPAAKTIREPEKKPEPEKAKPELAKPKEPEPIKEKAPEEPKKEKPPEKKGLLDRIFGGKKEEEPKEAVEERSFGQKIIGAITEATISEKDLDEIVDEFQIALLENDVALDVAEKMCADIKRELAGKRVKRMEIEAAIRGAIKDSLEDVLSRGGKSIDLVEEIKMAEKPYKIAFVGINGTGKTTTIAKLAWLLKENGLEPVIAASDTFRAASIEQLEQHTNKLGVKLIKHKYGADAAAVAFDAVEHAKAKGKAAVLIDTAGRMQTNTNLMDELKKIIRVIKPNLVIFVGDSLTGNDAIEQARTFNEARVDAIILTKADADAKGGACLSIAYEIGKPILYLGTGQNYPDLTRFTPEWFIEKVSG